MREEGCHAYIHLGHAEAKPPISNRIVWPRCRVDFKNEGLLICGIVFWARSRLMFGEDETQCTIELDGAVQIVSREDKEIEVWVMHRYSSGALAVSEA
jgi:hypothetical protein